MQKEDDEQLQEQQWEGGHSEATELSNVWRELLGLHPGEHRVPTSSGQQAIPILEDDPWRKLLEAGNVELVDLQQVHLPVSEREVEQMLQLMQEQATQDRNDGKDTKN